MYQDYPDEAIREAVVNAFAHRDYLLHSFIKIEFFADRMEILSLGGIPDGLTLEEIKDGMTAVQPEFKVTSHMFKVTFPNLNYQEKTDKVENDLSDEDRIIILLEEKGAISKSEIQEALNLSDYSSRKLLLKLRKENKVVKLGGSFNTKYKLK